MFTMQDSNSKFNDLVRSSNKGIFTIHFLLGFFLRASFTEILIKMSKKSIKSRRKKITEDWKDLLLRGVWCWSCGAQNVGKS